MCSVQSIVEFRTSKYMFGFSHFHVFTGQNFLELCIANVCSYYGNPNQMTSSDLHLLNSSIIFIFRDVGGMYNNHDSCFITHN